MSSMTSKRHLYYVTSPRVLCGINAISTYGSTGNTVLVGTYLFVRSRCGMTPCVPNLNQQDFTLLLVELEAAIEMADYLHEIYQLLAEAEISDTQVCSSILSSIILRLERTAARIDRNRVIEE
ncbi:MAG: hypothetical protein O0V67_05420 [Methanocorpusculum sp.]|nr:hypothetical protein [Methanocorpusculum sp.]